MGDINQMAASLKKFESGRRTWIAQISHELRTPLAVLRGELEAIEDGARQATPQVVANLQEEVLQLIRLVNDLHTLSVADMGQLRCEFVDGDAASIVAHAVQRFGPRIEKAGLTLELLAHAQPVRVRWDAGRIEQLLANLLENSVRYTHPPGRVRVRWQPLRQPWGDAIELWVEDTPPGVRQDELAQLFEPLYRADTARQRHRPKGDAMDSPHHASGLGLAIARAIAQAHHGEARAAISPLGGLAICITLPLDPETQERRHA
jgi:two-component system sensor histidine kinase BaeS